eukprot:TRINITY_DN3848_c0_g1_i11.p4 TRINITY_DN3848_c0_g1~~TRINITY_DN3848_c0_g1_i11.p4  ORF type:complete len:137 (+),score=15.59 TRINITY_DN3848_c0_g1_i11:176-586(+)
MRRAAKAALAPGYLVRRIPGPVGVARFVPAGPVCGCGKVGAAPPVAAGPMCGCGKPTWNNQWNQMCADMSCPGPPLAGPLPAGAAPPVAAGPVCGCGKPTWNNLQAPCVAAANLHGTTNGMRRAAKAALALEYLVL